MAANKGARSGDRPPWLPDGMDPASSYNIQIRIIARHTRFRWFSLDKVVDADHTNFVDLVAEVENKYPSDYGDVVSLFYFCIERQMNIQICTDQDLLDMFAKHNAFKCCFLTFCYHSPSTEPPEIPPWDFSSCWQSVENPFTPSLPCPSIAQPSHTQSETADDEYLANPNPSNEHVGVDEEGLYIDLGPQHPPPPKPQSQGCSKQRDGEGSDADTYCETDSDDESMSDDDDNYEMEDVDDIVKDNEPDHMPDAEYDKKDPPMTVGIGYRDMYAFKLALASHAVKHEFHYDIEKSDTGRYRVHCCGSTEGCRWRIHASTMKDAESIKVKRNPYPHTCQSKRRSGVCKGVTQFWVCEQVIDWLKEDATVGATELQRRLKDEYKIQIPYRRVCNEVCQRRGRKKQLKLTQRQALLWPQGWCSLPMRQWRMLYTRKERENPLLHHVSTTTPFSSRSGTGSNEPIPIQVVHLAPWHEDAAVQHEPQEASSATVHTPRRKIGLKKKLTPRKDVSATPARGTSTKAPADPSSPAENTRSKKQLLM